MQRKENMEYGVYTSSYLEIAQTRYWAICFYCNSEKTIIGARLYNGTDENKTLAAICERYIIDKKTVFAYETVDGMTVTNDEGGVSKLIGSAFSYNTDGMKKTDSIVITDPYEMATVDEKGIGFCLKQWRMGTSYIKRHNGFTFLMVTNKIEYVFSIYTDNCNIYCGASVNVPYDNGMFGGGQYFRFRNFDDNSKPWCRFVCNLGNDLKVPDVPEITCESGTCTVTDKGLFWPVKSYSNNEIILHGCEGDEYIYHRISQKSEYFGFSE